MMEGIIAVFDLFLELGPKWWAFLITCSATAPFVAIAILRKVLSFFGILGH